MNVIDTIKAFFNKDAVKYVLNIAIKLFKRILGRVASDLQTVAWESVKEAEATGRTGQDKYEYAFKLIKAKFPTLKDGWIDSAIQFAWMALESAKND